MSSDHTAKSSRVMTMCCPSSAATSQGQFEEPRPVSSVIAFDRKPCVCVTFACCDDPQYPLPVCTETVREVTLLYKRNCCVPPQRNKSDCRINHSHKLPSE